MAETEHTIDGSPEEVFDVLLDARSYEHWVVGCKDIRAVDAAWPKPGSRFHHTVGMGPLDVEDTTMVVEVDRPRRLILEARARPAGVAKVVFMVEPEDGRSRVRIWERPIRGLARRLDNRLLDGAVDARNAETLRRLGKQVEERRRLDR